MSQKKEVTLRYVVAGAIRTTLPDNWDKMSDEEKGIWANIELEVSGESGDLEQCVIDSVRDEAPFCEAIEDNENDYSPLIPHTNLWKAYRGEETER